MWSIDKMTSIVAWMDKRFYGDFQNNWDNALFRRCILNRLQPRFHVLDLGAGAGIVEEMNFRGRADCVCGLVPDERVVQNPHLDEGKIGFAEALPYSDAAFDLVFSGNVLEHLTKPEKAFAEVARVLREGGVFLAKTPNYRHYVPLIARLTPHRFHEFINRIRGRKESDTFPTHYRVNTPEQIQHYAAQAGLQVREISIIEGRPEYLRIHFFTYLFGLLYERIVNKVQWLSRFRVLIIAVLEKPGHESPIHDTCR